MITAVITLLVLATLFGALLGYASIRFKLDGNPIIDDIDNVLPQTQCGQCGHPGCRPYAEAIANGEDINKCPPGGEATIQALADLLDVEPMPLDAEHGEEQGKLLAIIREDECIGCTKCIQACPVDAILGAAKLMHTVIESECTGCDLCVEPCPVDCIDMVTVEDTLGTWHHDKPLSISESMNGSSLNSAFNIIATDKTDASDKSGATDKIDATDQQSLQNIAKKDIAKQDINENVA